MAESCESSFINEIIVLFNGYAKLENPNLMLANCTCTIVKGRGTVTIVDTRTAWDANDVINELGKYNLQPADITHVVCTHGHSDHIGCNHLFLNAKVHIVGNSVSHRESYYLHNFVAADYVIDDGVRVVRTPGHTLDSVSVLVSPTNLASCVAICGDLFENRDDVLDPSLWIDAGSESVGEQREHRHKIAMEADIIVPGHGGLFHVTDEIRNKLERNLHD